MKTFNEFNKEISEADFGSMASQLKKYGGKENVKDTPKAPQTRSKYAPEYTMTGHKEKNTSTGRQYSKVLPDYDDEDDVKSAKKSVTTGATPQEKRGRGRPKGVGAKAGQYKPRDPEKKAASAAKAAASKAANKAKKAALTNEDCEEIFEGLTFDDMMEVMIDEEVVALDELSKATLGSYIKKASKDVGSKNFTSGFFDRDADDYGENMPAKRKSYAALQKGDKRQAGLEKATDRLTKESVDEEVVALDELSKATLGSYIKKASKDVGSKNFTSGFFDRDADDYGENMPAKRKSYAALQKGDKRQAGLEKATDRLTKESVDEAADVKVGSIVTPKIGPHAGRPHTVIHVHDDGTFNIKPNMDVKKVKYHLGAARCSKKDLQESEFSLEELELFIESEEFNELDENELGLLEGIFNESSDTVVKDKSGKVVKFKHKGDWKDSKKDPIVDKSGAKHTAHSRVRDLARNAIKRASKGEINFVQSQNESEKAGTKPVINDAVAFYASKLTSNLIKE